MSELFKQQQQRALLLISLLAKLSRHSEHAFPAAARIKKV